MLLKEITTLLSKKISPKNYRLNSEPYGMQYDKKNNSKLIRKVVLTIDPSLEAIHFAIKNKVNLIISHHSLVNKPVQKFNRNLINKFTILSKYPISIYVLNSSFIAAG